jgi:hypothetical protein
MYVSVCTCFFALMTDDVYSVFPLILGLCLEYETLVFCPNLFVYLFDCTLFLKKNKTK